jgi:fatty-acyl-CoA synthase
VSERHLGEEDPLSRQGAAQAWRRALEGAGSVTRHPDLIFPTAFEQIASRFGDAPALLTEGGSLSYRALHELCNRYSRWSLGVGINRNDCVCLLMRNRPEYVAIWLGLTRMGVIVSLLNTNLKTRQLAHCIDLARPKHIIVGSDLLSTFLALQGMLSSEPALWIHGGDHASFQQIDTEIKAFSAANLRQSERRPVTTHDQALYIYTSGTTGFPKAANISHRRVMIWSRWFAGLMNLKPEDRMYNALPMYHSIGGIVAVGPLLSTGGSVVIRDKFSTNEFWSDVCRWECTLFQYIGELCRYLLNAPVQSHETQHRLRLCCGNGLQPDIWNRFKERFRIPQVLEFYAATEGNVSLVNVEGKPGSIGRIPPYLAHRFAIELVRFDYETEQPLRDELGYCIRCNQDETGEAIGKLSGTGGRGSIFEGYSSPEETETKIIRNAFEPGDAWYRTGDLMRRDVQGYFYFVDRIGDTFRWKGENVATSEIATILRLLPSIVEATVYGVPVPGHEGKACMAAVVPSQTFEIETLREHVRKMLPPYASPVFLRICERIETTGTFKHTKRELMKEGYDPGATKDPVFFNDLDKGKFVRVDETMHQTILSGKIKI